MRCCDSIKRYLAERDETFTKIYQHRKLSNTHAHYTYNWAEKTGNFLLRPMHEIVTTWDKRNCAVKVLLIFAGLLASICMLFGIIFKELGECANPNKQWRQEALKKQRELIESLKENFGTTTPSLPLLDVDAPGSLLALPMQLTRLFSLKILKEKHKASDEDISQCGLYAGTVRIVRRSSPTDSTPTSSPHLIALRTLATRWNEAWRKYDVKSRNKEEVSEEVRAIQELCEGDSELLAFVSLRLEKPEVRKSREQKIAQLGNELNNVLSHMTIPSKTHNSSTRPGISSPVLYGHAC